MKTMITALFIPLSFLLGTCANDIKGDSGDPGAAGQDATAAALISLMRPGYQSDPADATKLAVPASPANAARVLIDGTVYTNTANLSLDINDAGRNGLDSGFVQANTLYYLYAIPAESATTFDLICSLEGPAKGPQGFSAWSYLGGFITEAVTEVDQIQAWNGRVRFASGNGDLDISSTDLVDTAKVLTIPTTAKFVFGRASFSTLASAGQSATIGSTVGTPFTVLRSASGSTADTSPAYLEWPILEPQTLYLKVSSAGARVDFRTLGWIEDLTVWP